MVIFVPTMKSIGGEKKSAPAASASAQAKNAVAKVVNAAAGAAANTAGVSASSVQLDLSKVKVEPLFEDMVDFDTFAKSDFRVVKIEACLISAVYEYDGREGLNLLMLDDMIPAGAKLY